jgi:hypothetical protein
MDVESQPQDELEEEGSEKKNKTEQAEPAIKKPQLGVHTATLDSLPLSKKEMKLLSLVVLKGDLTLHHPKSDVELQPQSDSEEEASDKEKEIEEVESANKKPRPVEQIELPRKSPVDEKRRPILPPSDAMKNTKHKSKVVKKESPMSRSSRVKERHANRKKYYIENEDEFTGEIKVTGSRKLVEVYQEHFADKLTDNGGHKSLEKEEGNCTLIQKANAKLMVEFGNPTVGMGNLQNVYSKEKCDDSITTPSYLNVLTSYTC